MFAARSSRPGTVPPGAPAPPSFAPENVVSARPHRLLHTLEVATVGLPFCAFKLIMGRLLLRFEHAHAAGVALLVLGAIDVGLNLVNLLFTLGGQPGRIGVCTFQQLVALRRPADGAWREFGLSLDALFSFALVACMVGLGLLRRLAPGELALWNLAVVLNVLGAGVGRFAESLIALRDEPAPRP
jgi:hypothetical protein